jgi:hypothetical protein
MSMSVRRLGALGMVAVAGFGLAMLALAIGPAAAARDPAARSSIARTEIVVYEDPASAICQVFRRTIVPSYAISSRASRVPMRFIDITAMASDTPGLTSAITVVPTAVIMQDGQEVGRITGYWGPEAFAKLVSGTIGTDD